MTFFHWRPYLVPLYIPSPRIWGEVGHLGALYQRDRRCGMPWAAMLGHPFRGIWGQERRWRCNLVSIEPNEAGETWEGLQQVKDLKSDPFFPWRSTYLLISQYWGHFPSNSPLNGEKVKISQHHPADVCCGGLICVTARGKASQNLSTCPWRLCFSLLTSTCCLTWKDSESQK